MKRKIAIVTGGTRGIGRACAEQLIANNYEVYVLSRRRCDTLSKSATWVELDLTKKKRTKKVFESLLKKVKKVDLLVNNVGSASMGSVESTPLKQFRNTFDSNFFSSVLVTQLTLPYLRHGHGGDIVFMSSLHGLVPSPFSAAYCAAKSALNSFCESLAAEVAKFQVRVLILAPGHVRTASKIKLYKVDSGPYADEEVKLEEMLEKLKSGQFSPANLVQPAEVANQLIQLVDGSRPAHLLNFVDPQSQGIHLDRCQDLNREKTLSKNFLNIEMLLGDAKENTDLLERSEYHARRHDLHKLFCE